MEKSKTALLVGFACMRALSTGVEIVDQVLGGITPGLPCVIAGPSGAGRTVIALQTAASALESGRVVSFLCNEPAPFLMRQAASLGFDFQGPLQSGQLALLEMDTEIASLMTSLGSVALLAAIRREQPLTSLLIIDPFTVLTTGLFDEAQLRARARISSERQPTGGCSSRWRPSDSRCSRVSSGSSRR